MLPDVVIAVLAAGASRRLGRAKQLVPIGGEPLLRRQCRCALDARIGEVVAILGCDDAQHRQVIIDLPVEVRVNNEWEEGLAATLRSAVRTAKARRAALLVLQCDQYRIMPDDLRTLYEHWRWAPGIACVSRWGSYAGPPAILPVHYYDDVLRLRGDVGARSVLYDLHRPSPDEIRNPRAAFDLDSPGGVEDRETVDSLSARRRLMTRIVPVVAIVIAFLVPGSLSGELVMPDRPHQPGQDLFKSTLSEDLAWKPFPAFPPQVRLAVIVGQPSEAGPYTIRVRIPRGVKLMPHRHPEDRVYTVMSGVFYIGLGDRFDPDKLQAYPPGSVIVLPGNTPHFHWAKSSEYVTQVTAIGPLGIEYVNAKDDPRSHSR